MNPGIPTFETGFAKTREESLFPNLWDGLVGAWCPSLGKQGDKLRDWSGRNHHATLTGFAFSGATSNYVPGKFGYALDYDGSNDLGDAGNISEIDTASQGMSIAFWMKSSTSQTLATLISYDNNSSLSPSVDWYIIFNTTVRLGGFGNNSERDTSINQSTLTDGKWHHLVVVERQAIMEFYIDGVLRDSVAVTQIHANFGASFSLQFSPVENVGRYTGALGDIFLYNRELSSSEVRQLYLGASPLVPSFNTNPYATSIPQSENLDLTIVSDITESDLQTYNPESLSFTIVSDVTVSESIPGGPASFGSKILSYNPLIFVTDTNPPNIVKVDTTDPENLSWQTKEVEDISNLVDVILDSVNGFVYVIGNTGLISKINVNDLFDQTIIDLSDSDNLLTLAIDDENGLVTIGTENNIGELYLLDNRSSFIGNTDLEVIAENQFIGDSIFNSINGFIGDCDIQVLGQETFIGNCDFKCLTDVLDNIEPIKEIDFLIYIDNILLDNNDVDLSSIVITHTVDEKSTASLKLNNYHDKLNSNFNNITRTITNQNTLKILIDGYLEFEGKISNILPQYNNVEGIIINAKQNTPVYGYNFLSLSLPGQNSRLSLYDILTHNSNINNEFIDEDEENPSKFKGIKIPFGHKTEQSVERFLDFDTSGTLAEKIQQGTEQLRQLRTYFWSPTVRKFGNTSIKEETKTPVVPTDQPFHSIELPVFKLPDNFEGGNPNSNTEISGKSSSIFFAYIGTSLSPVSDDLWILENAKHRWQRIFPDKITRIGNGQITLTELENLNLGVDASGVFSALQTRLYIDGSGNILVGFRNEIFKAEDMLIPYSKNVKNLVYELMDNSFAYYLGEAPFKEVNTTNGILVPKERYEDRGDGLYSILDASFNYTTFIQKVAELEYQKLLNINGDILPDTDCTLTMTVDAYYYFGLKLLTKFNIDNTLTLGEFKNNNGFPLTIKSITINSLTRQITIQADNKKSSIELEAINGLYPNDDSDEFTTSEKVTLVAIKSDMKTRLKVE